MLFNPVARCQALHQGAVLASGRLVIDIFRASLLAQLGVSESAVVALVIAVGLLHIDK